MEAGSGEAHEVEKVEAGSGDEQAEEKVSTYHFYLVVFRLKGLWPEVSLVRFVGCRVFSALGFLCI